MVKKLINFIKSMRQIKEVRVFVRQVFNGFVTLVLTMVGTMNFGADFAFILPIIYAGINALTKYVNVTYFNDLGKESGK